MLRELGDAVALSEDELTPPFPALRHPPVPIGAGPPLRRQHALLPTQLHGRNALGARLTQGRLPLATNSLPLLPEAFCRSSRLLRRDDTSK